MRASGGHPLFLSAKVGPLRASGRMRQDWGLTANG